MKIIFALLLAFIATLNPAQAHKSSDSYLTLNISENAVRGHWDIALRDLDIALALDGNDDGDLTWGEVRAAQARIAAHALANVRVEGCALRAAEHTLVEHSDGVYTRIALASDCANSQDQPRNIGYTFLRDIDPQHRGILALTTLGSFSTRVLNPQDVAGVAPASSFVSFVREGIQHIVVGIDHVLFVALLVAATLRSHAGSLRSALMPLAQVVTAFTVAHSITLALAVFGVVNLPSRWIETLIALSVFLCAVDVFRPFLKGPRWAFAFGFGLLHGLGLASALTALTLPADERLYALFGFNIGVEIGQLAIAMTALGALYLLTRTRSNPQWIARFAALTIAAIALVWMIERSTDTKWLPL